jgi:hypothetical protein
MKGLHLLFHYLQTNYFEVSVSDCEIEYSLFSRVRRY